MQVKKQIRILGWDDGPFTRRNKKCIVIGCVFRGYMQIDGILRTYVGVDGFDATEKIADAFLKSKFKDVRVMMLDGITYAGFNVVNIRELSERVSLPVIAVLRKKPKMEEFLAAMKKLPNYEKRFGAVRDAGKIYSVNVERKDGMKGIIYFQRAGTSVKRAKEIIKVSIYTSLFPEPLRVAHLIATGVVLGKSVGRA